MKSNSDKSEMVSVLSSGRNRPTILLMVSDPAHESLATHRNCLCILNKISIICRIDTS